MEKVELNGSMAVSTGELGKAIGFAVPVDTIKSLGVEPAGKIKAGVYWRVTDIPKILDGLVERLTKLKGSL